MRRMVMAAAVMAMMASSAWAQESTALRESLERAARQPLAQAAQQAPAARPSRGAPAWLGWTVTAVGVAGLLAVEQRCDGLRVGDRCLGQTSWPAGQIAGWSAVTAGGVALLVW